MEALHVETTTVTTNIIVVVIVVVIIIVVFTTTLLLVAITEVPCEVEVHLTTTTAEELVSFIAVT